MKFVDRDSIESPSIFASEGAKEARQSLLETFSVGERKLHQTRVSSVGHVDSDELLGALHTLFGGRCAFCETEDYNFSIHRFRPPTAAEPVKDTSTSHLYYIWLSDAWQNLYPICDGCRPENRAYFPVTGSRLPLPNQSTMEQYLNRSDGRWPGYPVDEKAMLLDPCVDKQIWRSLAFQRSGKVVGVSRRGRETIQHFHLNRPNLIDGRNAAIEEAISSTQRAISERKIESSPKKLGYGGAVQLYLREVLYEALDRKGTRNTQQQIRSLSRKANGLERFDRAIEIVDMRRMDESAEMSHEMFSETVDCVTHVSIRNFKSLERIEFSVPQMVMKTSAEPKAAALLILGENATGKSTILEALAYSIMTQGSRARLNLDPNALILNPKYLGMPQMPSLAQAKIEITYAEAGVRSLIIQRSGVSRRDLHAPPQLPLFAYGAFRQFQKATRRSAPHQHVRSLFHTDELLSNPENWLLKLKGKDFDMVVRALREVFRIEDDFDVIEREKNTVYVVVGPSDSGAGQIRTPIELVSSGFRAVLAMLCDIMQGLMDKRLNPAFESLDRAAGLVLIDEVEAHLHPRWKMSIMTGLRRALPGITFIATSHDPLCLRGMGRSEVMVLERVSGKEGGSDLAVFIHNLVELPDNENWTIEQLLTADFFQLRTTESLEAEQRAAEMEDLLARGVKPSENPELREYLVELTDTLPIGHTEVQRLIQDAIAIYLKERRGKTDEKLKKLKANTLDRMLEALRRFE